ncbi:MAG: TadE/TadG family type IV pilus assembly protein [Bryobacteraceae bacterium]
MRANSRRRQRQSGVAMILLTLMLMSVLLPMVALAIDVTMLYVVKAKLQGAVDGAVLAAGRSITGAVTLAAQTPRLQNIAQQFLKANLPQGYWGATAPVIEGSDCTTGAGCVNVFQNLDTKKIFVTVTASVQVPLLFARTIWNKETSSFNTTSTVRVTGQALRRWVRLVLVLDRSSSMAGAPLTALKDAVTNSDPQKGFVTNFSEDRDQMGLVVFGGSAIVAYPPRDPTIADGGGNGPDQLFKSHSPNIVTLVNQLASGSNTGTTEGLILAYRELQKSPQPLYLNAIVLFTDGMPNGITAVYNGTTSPSVPSVIKTPGCTNYRPTDPPIEGWMAQWGGYADANGNGVGIYSMMQNTRKHTGTTNDQDVQDWMAFSGTEAQLTATQNAGGCHFLSGTNPEHRIGEDLVSFPIQDVYGNATNTADYRNAKIYHNINKALDMTAVTNAYQIGLISWNATFNAAKTIRSDTSLKPVIFCIGYNGGDEIDRSLMKRIANTNQDFQTWAQDSRGQYLFSDYDPTSTTGRYYEAATPGAIAAAFQQVQSEVLRLSM